MIDLTKESLIDFVTPVGTLVLLWIGAIEVVSGNMTVGSLVTFYSLLNYFLSSVQNLVELQGTLQTAVVVPDHLNDILELETEKSGELKLEDSIEDSRFEHVFFRYGNRDLVLNDLSFSVKKGGTNRICWGKRMWKIHGNKVAHGSV